jgi:protein translocase SecG subunit
LEIFGFLISLVVLVLCILLILGVLFLTTKSDGFAAVSGGSSSQFRGAQGAEAQLKQKVTWIAAAFMACSLILHIFT